MVVPHLYEPPSLARSSCAAAGSGQTYQSENWYLAGWGFLRLSLLLPGPTPLRCHILGDARQDDGRDQEVNDQVDPVGIAELQGDLGPEGDNLQDERVEPNPPPVLEEEGHSGEK